MIASRQLPDSVKCRHILIGTKDPQTGQLTLSDSIAKKRIDSIEAAIKGGEDFNKLVKEAKLLNKKKEYVNAGNKYSEAFRINNNLGSSMLRIDAACTWALAGKLDSAFN